MMSWDEIKLMGRPSPELLTTDERAAQIAEKATRRNRPTRLRPNRRAQIAVRRSFYLAKSPKAARRIRCDANGRASWVREWRLALRAARRAEQEAREAA